MYTRSRPLPTIILLPPLTRGYHEGTPRGHGHGARSPLRAPASRGAPATCFLSLPPRVLEFILIYCVAAKEMYCCDVAPRGDPARLLLRESGCWVLAEKDGRGIRTNCRKKYSLLPSSLILPRKIAGFCLKDKFRVMPNIFASAAVFVQERD